MSRNISLGSVIIIIKNIQIQFDRRKRERGSPVRQVSVDQTSSISNFRVSEGRRISYPR